MRWLTSHLIWIYTVYLTVLLFFQFHFFSEFFEHPVLIHRLFYNLKWKSLSQKLRACLRVCDHACKRVCGIFLHCLRFYVPVNSFSHAETVSSHIHTFFWTSFTKRIASTLCYTFTCNWHPFLNQRQVNIPVST